MSTCLGCGRLDFDTVGGDAGIDAVARCRSLDASWTPEWSQLIEYEPFDGSGAIANGAGIPAIVGMDGTASNTDATGMTYVAGKLGEAITFDGVDDSLTVPLPSIDTTPGDAISIAFWMRWNGVLYTGNSGDWTKIVLFKSPEYALTFVAAGANGPALGYNTGAGDLWGVRPDGLASAWVHVVAVFANAASDQSLIYLDGVAQAMGQTLGAANASNVSGSLLVAALPSYPSFYTGDLDELAVWNVALTPAEVASVYGAQAQCP